MPTLSAHDLAVLLAVKECKNQIARGGAVSAALSDMNEALDKLHLAELNPPKKK